MSINFILLYSNMNFFDYDYLMIWIWSCRNCQWWLRSLINFFLTEKVDNHLNYFILLFLFIKPLKKLIKLKMYIIFLQKKSRHGIWYSLNSFERSFLLLRENTASRTRKSFSMKREKFPQIRQKFFLKVQEKKSFLNIERKSVSW